MSKPSQTNWSEFQRFNQFLEGFNDAFDRVVLRNFISDVKVGKVDEGTVFRPDRRYENPFGESPDEKYLNQGLVDEISLCGLQAMGITGAGAHLIDNSEQVVKELEMLSWMEEVSEEEAYFIYHASEGDREYQGPKREIGTGNKVYWKIEDTSDGSKKLQRTQQGKKYKDVIQNHEDFFTTLRELTNQSTEINLTPFHKSEAIKRISKDSRITEEDIKNEYEALIGEFMERNPEQAHGNAEDLTSLFSDYVQMISRNADDPNNLDYFLKGLRVSLEGQLYEDIYSALGDFP